MSTFTDSAGRRWSIYLDVAAIDRIKAACGVDLLAIADGQLAATFNRDLSATASAVYLASVPAGPFEGIRRRIADAFVATMPAVVRRRVETRRVVRFKAGMHGDGFERGMDALVEALIDFFPNARRRPLLRATWQETKELDESVISSILSGRSSRPATGDATSGNRPEPSASTRVA